MLVNAAVQINEQYSSLSRRADAWNSSTLYDDKMSLAFTYGSRTLSPTENWGCTVFTVAESVAGYDEVYISGGEIWAFGSDNATLTSAYRLQTGVSYAGSILPVYSFSAADVNAGMVLRSGDVTKLAQYEGGKVIVDGYQYDGISLSIIPDGAETRTVDLTETLSAYGDLLQTVFETMGNANSSAKAVWNIYNATGKASTYLTTLAVPDNYANVDLTVAQKEILTVLALEQLSEYYQSNSGALKTQDYVMSDDSMSFFVGTSRIRTAPSSTRTRSTRRSTTSKGRRSPTGPTSRRRGASWRYGISTWIPSFHGTVRPPLRRPSSSSSIPAQS
jgi:hypothetical protein